MSTKTLTPVETVRGMVDLYHIDADKAMESSRETFQKNVKQNGYSSAIRWIGAEVAQREYYARYWLGIKTGLDSVYTRGVSVVCEYLRDRLDRVQREIIGAASTSCSTSRFHNAVDAAEQEVRCWILDKLQDLLAIADRG